jgi:N-terminal domain of anti-restriction factor ArdC
MEAGSTVPRSTPERNAFHSKKEAARQGALSRAVSGQSCSNFPAIFRGFAALGIPESEILSRENVFTFQAWRALGRTVRKGERGVRVCTFAEATRENRETGEKETFRRPWHTTVFHVSQTEPLTGSEVRQ